jgi:CubicO group peptidase (beta-lactamase class C family)
MTGITAAGAAALDAVLNRFVTHGALPGATAGVVHGDKLVWTASAGFADTSTHVTPGPGTLYQIASITKTFTGTAVMQLRDAGRLDLDDPAVASREAGLPHPGDRILAAGTGADQQPRRVRRRTGI